MTILSVLDQSPIRAGCTPAEALQETLKLAELCDRLGYHRYWLAEHHSTGGLAGSAMLSRATAPAQADHPLRMRWRASLSGSTPPVRSNKSTDSSLLKSSNEISSQPLSKPRMRVVTNDQGEKIVLTRNGEVSILDPKGRELEKHEVPTGAQLLVEEDAEVKVGATVCQWDPHSIPILGEVSGKVRYQDVVEGDTMRLEKDAGGTTRRLIIDHKGELHPHIVIEDDGGNTLDVYYLPERAHIEVDEGVKVTAGTVIAKTPREAAGIKDITGGLPRVTEIFEARKPKDPAVIAEVDGAVEILSEKKRGKRTIVVKSESGIEREHLVPHGKRFLVHGGDYVKAGQSLVDGPLVPHDILRISGEEAVQQYLVHEIQNVYRSQRVEINDKHIEIIVARMLRKVRIETPGDTLSLIHI